MVLSAARKNSTAGYYYFWQCRKNSVLIYLLLLFSLQQVMAGAQMSTVTDFVVLSCERDDADDFPAVDFCEVQWL